MKQTIKGLISGFTGAVTLTFVHQWLKNTVKDAPRVDLLGVEAIESFIEKLNLKKPSQKTLYNLSLAGDLIFNSIYYSSVAYGKNPLIKGIALGTGAGSGVINLPGTLNLNEKLISKNFKQALLSFGIYLIGGLTAAGTYKLLQKA